MENSIFLTTDLSIDPETVTPDILFADFYHIYYSDMEGRLKQTTLARKNALVCDKILPTFGALPMNAITPQGTDKKKHILKIAKTYVRHDHRDIISPPKTQNSVRNVAMPDFLYHEVMSYIADTGLKKNDRIIPRSADFLKYHLKNERKKSGVPQIRIHGIRHSHVSLLINQGFTAIAIAERVGHKHISTTMNVYARLFPSRQEMLVQALEKMHDESSYLITAPPNKQHQPSFCYSNM